MMKLNILNMKNFLETINQCNGAVNVLYPDRKRLNINKAFAIQNELQKEYHDNGNCLRLMLDVKNPQDYISIVSYYAGDC